jgi:hypothetical protein
MTHNSHYRVRHNKRNLLWQDPLYIILLNIPTNYSLNHWRLGSVLVDVPPWLLLELASVNLDL